MDKQRILKAVYKLIPWDRLYEEFPDATRRQVDELFRELGEYVSESPDGDPTPEGPPPDLSGRAVQIYTDGASSGNPGPAGIGIVILDPGGVELAARGAGIGRATNNVAEYRAVIEGLKMALKLGAARVRLCTDSELLVRQVEGAYKVKSARLRPLFDEVKQLLARFGGWEIRHVPRDLNTRADALATRHAQAGKKAKRKG